MGKSQFVIKIGQMFCIHDWDIKSWILANVFPKPKGKDPRVLSTCHKCGKMRALRPLDSSHTIQELSRNG